MLCSLWAVVRGDQHHLHFYHEPRLKGLCGVSDFMFIPTSSGSVKNDVSFLREME